MTSGRERRNRVREGGKREAARERNKGLSMSGKTLLNGYSDIQKR